MKGKNNTFIKKNLPLHPKINSQNFYIMDLKEILTISGKPGLYKLISNNNNKGSFIVESLQDQRRFPAFTRDKVSPLEEISVFTSEDDMPLREVFVKLFTYTNKTAVAPEIINDNEKLKQLFESFLPKYDRERLYVSHMKKIIAWYNILVEHNLISDDKPVDENDKVEEKIEEEKTTAKRNYNKPAKSTLKKTIVDQQLPKNATTKKAAPTKSISTKPKAK